MVLVRFNPSERMLAWVWNTHLRELLVVGGAYFAYMYTRYLVFADYQATALANANNVISLEQSLGLFWEPQWQQWALTSAKFLVVFFNWAYIITFGPIIITTALILYVANRARYRYYRNIVLLSFFFALVAFMLFPLAPPRMMAGHFVDTIKSFGPVFYASREFANFYNPYAAMPSLHFGWTVMFGILFLRTPNKWVRIFGVIYPTMTLFAITITANHYFMDAVGGVLLITASFVTVELGYRRRLFIPRLAETLQPYWSSRGLHFLRLSGGKKPLAHGGPRRAG
ncbi:MAG: phosphatase PAP2 family protein [Chloroflexota bacterium]